MKALAFVALTTVATAAMAVGPTPDPEIKIYGTSVQTASLVHSVVSNTATSHAEAIQNLASNAGDVTINGYSQQSVGAFGSFVGNLANGYDAYASQNMSSNLGDVTIWGRSFQGTNLINSGVLNTANGSDARAVQNVASNNACVSCQPSKGGNGHGHGHGHGR